MTETELLVHVVETCRRLGLKVYHAHDSRRDERGFPDLVIVGRRLICRELKSQPGRLSPAQTEWLVEMRRAGIDAGVWRPEHWPDEITGQLQVLAWR